MERGLTNWQCLKCVSIWTGRKKFGFWPSADTCEPCCAFSSRVPRSQSLVLIYKHSLSTWPLSVSVYIARPFHALNKAWSVKIFDITLAYLPSVIDELVQLRVYLLLIIGMNMCTNLYGNFFGCVDCRMHLFLMMFSNHVKINNKHLLFHWKFNLSGKKKRYGSSTLVWGLIHDYSSALKIFVPFMIGVWRYVMLFYGLKGLPAYMR